MQNSFIIIRAIFFTLILYFNLLAIIFAGWNIMSSTSSGMPVPGAAAFLIVNAALIFSLTMLAYSAEVICPKARPSHVRFECGWTVLMGVLQLAASIYVTTASSPVLCQSQSTWTICASAALLIPISWLATFIMLVYCVTLCVMAATHVHFMPALWKMPVTAVPWFNLADSIPISFPSRPLSDISLSTWAESGSSCKVTEYIADTWERFHRVDRRVVEPSKPILFSRNRSSIDPARPAWAKQFELQTRRGVDQPFLTQRLSPSSSSPKVPLPPPKACTREMSGLSDFKYAGTFTNLELDKNTSCSTLTPRTPTIFPKRIADPDLPIPRPQLSEWIPADAVNVTDIHELWPHRGVF
ncbi:uncharacterized protein EDB93DRAFT_663485 [Suillus bovinus]|uniref:uncharacterized protein n=1 Tax=Suillus bovinus TaxID=48563 RepID=UPI001B86571E|nr:uncharacterized protein EDB93DRAFT_663485 [Suillus bovinus]KAG2158363.1 hypothetical protein EDB93DRAFT_663485 [Suillus bovinus]